MTDLRRRWFIVSATIAITVASSGARADDASCFNDAERGQQLRNEGKLIESRGRFIACSRGGACPDEVMRDCAHWLAEVDELMPTAVFVARETTKDLVDVRVTIDGAPSGTTAEGRPITIDPGPHAIRFIRRGAPIIEETIVIRAGEKNRMVLVTYSPAKTPKDDDAPAREQGRSIPTMSLVLGGVGVVALGAFGYFGLRGVSDYDRYGCEVGCRPDDKTKVDSALVAADIGLGVGIAALTGAALVYLLQPKKAAATAASGRDPFRRW